MSDYGNVPMIRLASTAKKQETVSTLDECARRCSNTRDFSCRSFDYCVNLTSILDPENNEPNCFLHTFHVSMTKPSGSEEEKVKIKADPNEDICEHYSSESRCPLA